MPTGSHGRWPSLFASQVLMFKAFMDSRPGRFDILSTLLLPGEKARFLVVSCLCTVVWILSPDARLDAHGARAGRQFRRKSKRRKGLVFSKPFRGSFIVSRYAPKGSDFAPRFSPGRRPFSRPWPPRFPSSGRTIRRDLFMPEPLTPQGLRGAAPPPSPGPQTPPGRPPLRRFPSGARWKKRTNGPGFSRSARARP